MFFNTDAPTHKVAPEPTVEIQLVFKDWRGKDITIGSKVLYPSEYGNGLRMVEGEVTKIVTRQGYSWDGDNLVSKPVTKVTVKPERRSQGNNWRYQAATVTISVLSNLTVVE
ncbi:hypothetical protein ACIBCT_35520 [Streptosporangium sp. NPDC050855]|uniref:hypothetical protein n=1 Tax=Streptosporangium sp. NPDC050855 TaxID=3366194 RepID=UPI0037AC521D